MSNYLVLHHGVSLFLQGDVAANDQFGDDAKHRDSTIARLLRLGAIQVTDADPTHVNLENTRMSSAEALENEINLPEFAKKEPYLEEAIPFSSAYNPPAAINNVPVQHRQVAPEVVEVVAEGFPFQTDTVKVTNEPLAKDHAEQAKESDKLVQQHQREHTEQVKQITKKG